MCIRDRSCAGGGGGGGSTGGTLTKGVTVTGLSAATGGEVVYTLAVPAGATNLTITMSGGTGDAAVSYTHLDVYKRQIRACQVA